MSCAPRQSGRQNSPQPPMPPSGGWTLMEAAEALCPREAELYRNGGAELEEVVRRSMGHWGDLLAIWPEGWMRNQLYAALCTRPDLELTGRDLARGVHALR